MAQVTLDIARPDQRRVLANLFQLYTHDFSEQWFDRTDGDLEETGLYPDYVHLDSYWTDTDRTPLLIRADGRIAGFALINRFSHSGLPLDHAVAEFFVVRKHRRAGVGRLAAGALMRARPGQWELAVARRNLGALAFWRKLSGDVATGVVHELDHDDTLWNGPILRFVVP